MNFFQKIFSNGPQSFCHAVEVGDINKVKSMIQKTPNLLYVFSKKYYETPLHIASRVGHLEITKLLLQKGAYVESKDGQDVSPLHRAAANGHEQIAKLLIQNGSMVDAKDRFDHTPLFAASANGYSEIVTFLLNKGANINTENEFGETPLHISASNGHKKVVETLIQKGAIVNKKNKFGMTPQMLASDKKHNEVVEILRLHEAQLNHQGIQDVLSSQSKLFTESMQSDKKFEESIKLQNNLILQSEQYILFNKKFEESLQLKNISSLSSALLLRQQGTNIVREEPALYCVGKHNEMVLEFDHIGHGIEARNSALESLKNEEKFKNIALALFPMFSSDYYEESIDHMISLSTSYDEGFYYFSKLKEQFPNDRNKRRYQEIKDIQSKYSRWFKAHHLILGTFYSRAKPELNNGRYACGISVIDLILTNSQNFGYCLDYEEYVDLLDDICALAAQLIMQKVAIRNQFQIYKDESKELGCIMEKPIKYLTDFYPECLPKDKKLFNNHFKSWKLIPWISEVLGWKELSSLLS